MASWPCRQPPSSTACRSSRGTTFHGRCQAMPAQPLRRSSRQCPGPPPRLPHHLDAGTRRRGHLLPPCRILRHLKLAGKKKPAAHLLLHVQDLPPTCTPLCTTPAAATAADRNNNRLPAATARPTRHRPRSGPGNPVAPQPASNGRRCPPSKAARPRCAPDRKSTRLNSSHPV